MVRIGEPIAKLQQRLVFGAQRFAERRRAIGLDDLDAERHALLAGGRGATAVTSALVKRADCQSR